MDERLLLTGIILILIGIFLIVVSPLIGPKSGNTKVEIAVGGFIGPFPFGFATSKEMLYILIIVMFTLLLLSLLLFR